LQNELLLYQQTYDKKNIDFSLHLLGQIAMKQADYDQAEIYVKEALSVQRSATKSDIARSTLTLVRRPAPPSAMSRAGTRSTKPPPL